jgi:hypothetical protein
MSCARDPHIQYNNNSYLNKYPSSITGNYSQLPITQNLFRCRKFKGFYPSFAPTINDLSITSSNSGQYSLVYINGTNFLPQAYGITYVNFGNFTNLPIIFYSQNNISFLVPLNASIGNYNVLVVNIYNNNFSPSVKQNNPGNINNSNSITYTIT